MSARYSEADEPDLISDPELVAKVESENALRQYDSAMTLLDLKLNDGDFRLLPSEILELHRVLMERVSKNPGVYRSVPVKIKGSKHIPPEAKDVARLVEKMCDYVRNNWNERTSIHLASYVLWRLNWIHPFTDGNGRTARIVSYFVLCLHSGTRLPGTLTIPEQISQAKSGYYVALEYSDEKFSSGEVDVGGVEEIYSNCLANQLLHFYREVNGGGDLGALDEATRTELNRVLQGVQSDKSEDYFPDTSGELKKRRGIVGLIESHPVISGGIFLIIVTIIGIFWQ